MVTKAPLVFTVINKNHKHISLPNSSVQCNLLQLIISNSKQPTPPPPPTKQHYRPMVKFLNFLLVSPKRMSHDIRPFLEIFNTHCTPRSYTSYATQTFTMIVPFLTVQACLVLHHGYLPIKSYIN
jgi:hypothetical protein